MKVSGQNFSAQWKGTAIFLFSDFYSEFLYLLGKKRHQLRKDTTELSRETLWIKNLIKQSPLLAMCRGELSEVIASSVCEAGGSGSEELKKCPPPSPAVL